MVGGSRTFCTRQPISTHIRRALLFIILSLVKIFYTKNSLMVGVQLVIAILELPILKIYSKIMVIKKFLLKAFVTVKDGIMTITKTCYSSVKMK